jgi:hypothetical protein
MSSIPYFYCNFSRLLVLIWVIFHRTSVLLVPVVLKSLRMNIRIVLLRMFHLIFSYLFKMKKCIFRTYVTFDKSTRSIGQASKAMEVTNAKNTINNFKRLLGRRYQDSYVQHEKAFNAFSIVEGPNGSVNIEV